MITHETVNNKLHSLKDTQSVPRKDTTEIIIIYINRIESQERVLLLCFSFLILFTQAVRVCVDYINILFYCCAQECPRVESERERERVIHRFQCLL